MKQRYFLLPILCLAALVFLTGSFQAQTTYVKIDAPGTNDGSTWQDAYTSLDAALANTISGEIWVAAGTYHPGGASPDSSSVFAIGNNLSLYGGFNGTETTLDERDPAANETILSADINGDDVTDVFDSGKSDNTQHVIYVDSLIGGAVVIDGFSIIGGYTSDFNGQDQYFWRGGGIYALSTIAVRHCRFYNNFARSGGAVCITGGASGSTFTDCSFSHNATSSQSAGIFADGMSNIDVRRCIFTENQTNRGAIYPLYCNGFTIDSCEFVNNVNASGFGGAMFIWGSTGVLLTNSTFESNTAANAACIHHNGSEAPFANAANFVIQHCQFISNTTTGFGGGGIYNSLGSFTMEDCLFEGNSANNGSHIFSNSSGGNMIIRNTAFTNANSGGWGGAMTCYGLNGHYLFENCTFENNTAVELGGAVNNGFAALATYDGCTFTGNQSTNSAGGALALQNDSTTVTVLNSSFSNNVSSSSGGAIAASSGSSSCIVMVDGSEFWANDSGSTGGAINVFENGDDDISILALSNSLFAFNSAATRGGAVNLSDADASIVSSVFFSNIADDIGTGGAISFSASDSNHVENTLMNCTFADNFGMLSAGIANWTGEVEATSNTTLQNCIFRQDGGLNYAIEAGTPAVVSNGGNMSDDSSLEDYLTHPKDANLTGPDFEDPGDFNYRLADGSPGIDAGVNDGAPEFDIEGNPRINDVDMGAYENQNVVKTGEVLLDNNGIFRLTPNPATGSSAAAKLDNNWTGPLEVRFVNTMGQVVQSSEVEKTGQVFEFELPLNVEAGVFNVVISNGNEAVVARLVRY